MAVGVTDARLVPDPAPRRDGPPPDTGRDGHLDDARRDGPPRTRPSDAEPDRDVAGAASRSPRSSRASWCSARCSGSCSRRTRSAARARPVVFEVTSGESFSQIADTMAAKGIIGSAFALRLDLAVTGTPPRSSPGGTSSPTSSSFPHVRAVLSGGPNASAVVVSTARVLERGRPGPRRRESARGSPSSSSPTCATASVHSPFQPSPHGSLEGLLAPGTYVLVPNEAPSDPRHPRWPAGSWRARPSVGLTPTHDPARPRRRPALTVASIVEKEGYLARNMPKVATVVYNRLARGSPLQMDATVEYAIGQDGGPVTHATERTASPYNTYLHTGLTPTPICIPSTQALDAALHAPSGPWLYFTLVDRDGTLAFAHDVRPAARQRALARRAGALRCTARYWSDGGLRRRRRPSRALAHSGPARRRVRGARRRRGLGAVLRRARRFGRDRR